MALSSKSTTHDRSLIVYPELTPAERRTIQRRVRAGELQRIVPGIVTNRPPDEWPALLARERIRVLATLYPGSVIGYRSAFRGGLPVEGVIHLNYSYDRVRQLPGLTVVLVKASGKALGDIALAGRDLYFPSNARLLMENLTISRGKIRKTVGREEVEERLMTMCESRGGGLPPSTPRSSASARAGVGVGTGAGNSGRPHRQHSWNMDQEPALIPCGKGLGIWQSL